ncbi:hypothetical protein DDF62_24660 [Caulobacter radicis]|uniref:response regulator n=1 Tax=Caulobacter radicis TaxID=2172650 RepID=UPI000D5867EB|nr:response regulator [Caulobacter radicis]PVM83504.1 hypothetical protein DDF62_24660 [Caulobacter radicis]
MAVFLFYPRLHDGACLTFVTASLADDAEALRHAALVLADHDSAETVSVWQGERPVGAVGQGGFTSPSRGAVLLVEDCFFQAEAFSLSLRGAGFAVTCAGDEAQALAHLRRHDPDAALVDLDLGEGPSYAVAEALEAQGAPFLFITGYDPGVLPPRWRHVDHVCKPVMGGQVVEAAERLLGPTLTRNPAAPHLHRAPPPHTA